jgi:hypothetical protein
MACRRTADDLVLAVAKVEKQTTAVAVYSVERGSERR